MASLVGQVKILPTFCFNNMAVFFILWSVWQVREMYLWVLRRFKLALQQGSREARQTRASLARQDHFVDQLVSHVKVTICSLIVLCLNLFIVVLYQR